MTVTSIPRVDTKNALLGVFASAAAEDSDEIAVTYSPPRDGVPDRAIFFGATTGTMLVPAMQADRKQYHDTFTVNLVCAVTKVGEADAAESDAAAWRLFDLCRSALADAIDLNGQVPGLLEVQMSGVHGPDGDPFELGFESVVVAEIDCQARCS